MVYSVIGKGFWNAPHFSSPGARVRPSSRFTNNLPTWRISTFNLLFHTGCNLSWGWMGRGGSHERLALGVGTGTGHSNFPSGRRINHRLSLPQGTRIGPKAILRFCGQLPKKRVEKWSSGALQFTNLKSYKWSLSSKNILRGGNEDDLKARQNCRKEISGGRFESPLKHMKSGKTSTMLHLAKKGVWVCSWIYWGKNPYPLPGQPNKPERQISTTKKSHLPWVKRAILKKCRNEKCRTGQGEKGALLGWWAGCKLPTATLEKCMVFPKTSKKHS